MMTGRQGKLTIRWNHVARARHLEEAQRARRLEDAARGPVDGVVGQGLGLEGRLARVGDGVGDILHAHPVAQPVRVARPKEGGHVGGHDGREGGQEGTRVCPNSAQSVHETS